jgi:glycosyltransferase involved in cell wall biosynthesis
VGLYAVSKGQEAALRAFSDSRIGNATLVFIGNEFNDYARHLQQLAAHLPLGERSAVLFLEQQARANIRAAYLAADLVLLASKGETQPLVLLDAMACGKPFLSTDVGCVSEMPGGVTVRTAEALAGQLRSLRDDMDRRRSLGNLGRAAAQSTYYWPSVIEAYERLIRQVGSRSQTKPS